MQGDDLSILLFWITLAVTFGYEAVKAETKLRRICLGVLAGIFLLCGVFWLQLKKIWPPLTETMAAVANSPQTWFTLFIFISAIIVFGRPKRKPNTTPNSGDGGLSELLETKIEQVKGRVYALEETGGADDASRRQIKEIEVKLEQLVTTVVNLAKDTDARVDRLSDSIEQIRGQLSGMHNRIESDRNHTASIFRIFSTSLRARDAEAIIKEADEVAMTVSTKLMTGGYPDESAWTADYSTWRDAIGRIDGVVSSWQDHHRPYLAIGLKELEAGAPTPPPESNVTSSNGVMWYKTVWLVQQSYSNHRESMRRYFHAKAGELPG
jgi:hypothetical protein